MSVTRTTGRLHFSDLDPIRFEDLCLSIISRLNCWKSIKHYGRKGNDDGVDILATLNVNDTERSIHIQCKRYNSIARTDLKKIINKLNANSILPDKLLIIVGCDVSKSNHEFLENIAKNAGIKEVELWTASVLEAKLYSSYPDILFTYFGVDVFQKTEKSAEQLKHSLEMERRMEHDFVDKEYISNSANWVVLRYMPSNRFISNRVIIRSVVDKSYPNCDEALPGEISSWFRVTLHDFYDNGIEVWLKAAFGTVAFIDDDNHWEPVTDFFDKRLKGGTLATIPIKWIGRIPYKSIVDYKIKGDSYYSDPHIYCKFEHDGTPYEEIYYKAEGDPNRQIPDIPLSKDMQTVF